MTTISFEFSRLDHGVVSGFDLGDMVVVIGSERHSSAGRKPSQSMMIYLALPDLIDGLCTLADGRSETFEFIGADSSFSIKFAKHRDMLKVSVGRKPVGEVPTRDALRGLWSGVNSFLAEPKNQLSPADAAHEDLHAALDRLRNVT